jgi:Tfp pilus assembly protein PilX
MRLGNRKKRGQRGFSLIVVISVSVVMFLIATTLYLKVGAQRANAVAQRGESDSFYAADAGINALAGQLSASGFGTKTVSSTALSFVTAGNLTGLMQADVTTAVLNGTISLNTAYQGATPTNNGDGLGSLVYSFRAVGCQAGTANGPNTPCPADETNVVNTLNATNPLPANIARIDVMSLGFRGKSVASNVAVSIIPNPKSFFAINKFAGFGDSKVTVGNGDTYSAMPFCNVVAGVANCQQVTYISAVLRDKATGAIAYVTDPTTALNLCSSATATNCNEKVTGIYKNGTGAFFATASNNALPNGAMPWSPVEVDASNHLVLDANGNPKPLPLPSNTTGTLSSFAPALPDGALLNNGGVLSVDSTYSYLPKGTDANLGSNGSGGGTAISTSSGSTVNGTLAAACGTTCISVGGTATGGTMGIPQLDLPPAPTAPTYSDSTCSGGSPTGSCTISVTGNGLTADGQAIIPVACSTDCGSRTGADKYPVINLVGSNGSGGVSLSGQKALTLYPGRYIVSDLDIAGQAILKTVQTNGDPVVIYVVNRTNVEQVETISISGNGIANTSTAAGLQIYSNTSDAIKLNGNGALRAAIYAPNSSLTLNGGGNSGQLVGTYIGKTIDFNGNNAQIVYDESLGSQNLPIVTGGNVRLANWRRL